MDMADLTDTELDPTISEETSEGTEKPAEKPDPTAALIEHTRRIIEQTTQSSERAIKLAQQALEQRPQEQRREVAPVAEIEEDFSDIDLADTGAGLKKLTKRIEDRIERRVNGALQNLVSKFDEVYTRDRNEDFDYRSTLERDRAKAKLGKKFEELEGDIEAIIDPIRRKDPKSAARPGIYTDAYYVALGKQRHEELVSEERRAPALGMSGRSTGLREGPARIATEDRERLRNTIGVDVDDDELTALNSGNVTDYMKFVQKRSAGGKR
jgi:hypothetical protein